MTEQEQKNIEIMGNVYHAEATALRQYYARTKSAINELESTLRIIKSNLSDREQKALAELLGVCK